MNVSRAIRIVLRRISIYYQARQHTVVAHITLSDWGKMHFDKELDARGLNCPLPILRTKKALMDLQSGQVLHILATDPGSVKDFAAFAKQTGNELLASHEVNREFEFFMRRK